MFSARLKFRNRSWTEIWRRDKLSADNWRLTLPLENQRTGENRLFVIYSLLHTLSHHTLGQGSEHGVVQFEHFTAANWDIFFRRSGSTFSTFPPNTLTFN